MFSLAKDNDKPLLIEMIIEVPSHSTCEINVDYETAYLKLDSICKQFLMIKYLFFVFRITDFSADAHNGLFVPGPFLTVPKLKNTSINL